MKLKGKKVQLFLFILNYFFPCLINSWHGLRSIEDVKSSLINHICHIFHCLIDYIIDYLVHVCVSNKVCFHNHEISHAPKLAEFNERFYISYHIIHKKIILSSMIFKKTFIRNTGSIQHEDLKKMCLKYKLKSCNFVWKSIQTDM